MWIKHGYSSTSASQVCQITELRSNGEGPREQGEVGGMEPHVAKEHCLSLQQLGACSRNGADGRAGQGSVGQAFDLSLS